VLQYSEQHVRYGNMCLFPSRATSLLSVSPTSTPSGDTVKVQLTLFPLSFVGVLHKCMESTHNLLQLSVVVGGVTMEQLFPEILFYFAYSVTETYQQTLVLITVKISV
jgi:hypothetical protein